VDFVGFFVLFSSVLEKLKVDILSFCKDSLERENTKIFYNSSLELKGEVGKKGFDSVFPVSFVGNF
jgi:hypothetical protein